MQKINFKKITIREITTSAFLLILIIISKQSIFTINMGVMKVGLTYTFLIATGLILNFFLGITIVILGDTLGLLLDGSIGMWHYSYFLIPIFIFSLTFIFRNLFKINNYKFLALFNLVIFIAMAVTIISLIIVKNDFISKSKNNEINIDFTNKSLKILVWVMFGLMSIYSILITFFYWKYQSEKLKDYLIINVIVSCIIVILIWFYGPFAQILWLTDTFNKDYWGAYSIYQIPRILKTPVILLVYNFIVFSIYKVYKQTIHRHTKVW